jgi:large subunit ribosomal protein L24
MLLRVNDIVEVISGRDRGQRGKVLKVDRAEGRVVVEGLNRVFKHVKKSQRNPQGGRLSKEDFISVSKVMIVCPKTGKPSRIGVRFLTDGSKERFCRKSGASLGVISPARPAHAKTN